MLYLYVSNCEPIKQTPYLSLATDELTSYTMESYRRACLYGLYRHDHSVVQLITDRDNL